MRIPSEKREQFVREIVEACLVSQSDRIQRGMYYKNYFLTGTDQPMYPAAYNRTFTYIDDLESTLYSPVSLKLHIGDPDLPNLLTEAKGRAAASRLRIHSRRSNTDSMTSSAVGWALIKGKTFIKQMWKGSGFKPDLIQPEAMGVLKENYGQLDEGMEAFTHSMLLTPFELKRLIWNAPRREETLKKLAASSLGQTYPLAEMTNEKQVIVGGLYPFQPAGSPNPNNTRGIVDWMGGPSPTMSPAFINSLVRLDEAWIWDDERADWATFQIIGETLVFGKLQTVNALGYNTASKQENPDLKGRHPFCEFCPNPLEGYFWGRSEIVNVALLQEFINKRISGINRMLRKEEEPSTRFVGSTGVNQMTLSRYRAPGGYFADPSPNAKIEDTAMKVPADVWAALHEYERMFDSMAGKPPVAQGRGDQGVRGQGHAQTLLQMASPRFKDRALLVERDCEGMYSLMLDLARAHDPKKIIAWVPRAQAGDEALPDNPLIIPPVAGQAAVPFTFANLDEDVVCTIDSHSASPIFAMEAKQLMFDYLKVGAASVEDLIEHTDSPDPDGMIAGAERRAAEKAQEIAKLTAAGDEKAALRLVEGKKR